MTRVWGRVGLFFAATLALCAGYVTLSRDSGVAATRALGWGFPTVMAHRGASYLAPEETEWAYRLARATGADFLEADIQRSKDGVLFALHDDTLERTTDAKTRYPGREKLPVSEFTWDELSQLDAGSWFNAKHPERARPEYVGAKLLRLDRLIDLALASDRAPSGLYLETKSPERFPGIEADLVKLLAARGYAADPVPTVLQSRLVFQSFSADSLRNFQKLAPHIPRVYLLDEDMVKKTGFAELVAQAERLGHGIGPVGYYAYPWHNQRAHARGLVVHPYTINSAWQLRLARFFGADGVFTDRCELAVPLLGRGPAQSVDSLWREAAASPLPDPMPGH